MLTLPCEQVTQPVKHMFQMYLRMLEMGDIIELVANDLTGKYCLPDMVKVCPDPLGYTHDSQPYFKQKTAQDYASAAILAPNIQAYKAPGLVAAVIVSFPSVIQEV